MKLSDLIQIDEDKDDRQKALKRAFMPYSELIDVDECEVQTVIILLNLSCPKPKSKDLLDPVRANSFLRTTENIDKSLMGIKWIHTHNLKYPDSRVKDQRVIASVLSSENDFISSAYLKRSYGWSHNAAVQGVMHWLLNEFNWQGEVVSLLSLIKDENSYWLEILKDFGYLKEVHQLFKEHIHSDLPSSAVPDTVSPYSKQVRFPWKGEYIAVTPIVSHAMQVSIERLSRNTELTVPFRQIKIAKSQQHGNLPSSLGGYTHQLYAPLDIAANERQTLAASRSRTHKYFDDSALTDRKCCGLFRHLVGTEPLTTSKKQKHVRAYQISQLRQRIALWLLPLVELREHCEKMQKLIDDRSYQPTIYDFLTMEESQLVLLTNDLNQYINLSLQHNKFSIRYAYHPKLMPLLKLELKQVLKLLSSKSSEQNLTADEQYIYLSDLRTFQCLATSSPYLCGVPSMTAIWGFVHQYQRSFAGLIQSDSDITFSSFAICFKKELIYKSSTLSEASNLAAKKTVSSVKRTSFNDEYHADLEFDLIIKVKANIDLNVCVDLLKAVLPTQFAGGSLFPAEKKNTNDWIYISENKKAIFYRVKGLSNNALWLMPQYQQQPNNLPSLISLITGDDSLIPISAGYHFLETPSYREGALCKKHAYAENVLMLAKKVKPIDLRLKGDDYFYKNAFWSLGVTSSTILIEKNRDT